MVQVDLPAAFAAGQILALLGRGHLRNEQHILSGRLLGVAALYFSLVFAPAGLFLLIAWPAWESMYWWGWIEAPAGNPVVALFYVGFFITMVLLGVGGFALGHFLYRRGKDRAVKTLICIGLVLTLAPFFIWPLTWYYVGDYAQYHAVPKTTTIMYHHCDFLPSWVAVMTYVVVGSLCFGWLIKSRAGCIEAGRS